MCDTCGCGQPADAVTYRKPGRDEGHHHQDHHQDHDHPHHADQGSARIIEVQQDILQQNNLRARRNRDWLLKKRILALNLVSSPGSGKTTLLEKTIRTLQPGVTVSVIEGDQQTLADADRIAAAGAAALQINTGHGCHLDAEMIHRAVHELDPPDGSLLMIENVGNLVCPALFDLGEAAKVVILSVTEGDDKPRKYPTMFAAADLCLINKIDLLPHVDFDPDECEEAARSVNPDLKFLRLSAKTGEGMEPWCAWLRERLPG